MTLLLGDRAPNFTAPTPSNPRFSFASAAGRYLVLAFFPSTPGLESQAVMQSVRQHRALFDDVKTAFFGVLRNPEIIAAARDSAPGLRWFLDHDGEVFRQFKALDEEGVETPHILVLDPLLRAMLMAPLSEHAEVFRRLRELPAPELHAGVPVSAPVLVLPRIFEPEFCRRLIDYYETHGGEPSGFMVEIDGRTVGVNDGQHKRRADATIEDPELRAQARARIERWLIPEIERFFQFKATRMERYIVACYDSQSGGWFRPHRDNTTKGTAHRKFAVTMNLNAEAFEGGELRFPEFGPRTYRAPTGGAVVFSCSMLHEATPVTAGRRFAFLPFLYDEAGARLREANNAYLDESVGAYSAGKAAAQSREEEADAPVDAPVLHAPAAIGPAEA